jgi:hypothetical protein
MHRGGGIRPQLSHEQETLFEPCDPNSRTLKLQTGRGKILSDISGTETELQSAVRDDLEGGRRLRREHGVAQSHVEDEGAYPDRIRDRGNGS